ncbi:MAG: hypothetical protein ABI691_03580 [Ginsengibacter sp.]
MNKTLIKCATIVNEGKINTADVLIAGERIEKIETSTNAANLNVIKIDAEGLFVIPGMIDAQVHFRERGLIQTQLS